LIHNLLRSIKDKRRSPRRLNTADFQLNVTSVIHRMDYVSMYLIIISGTSRHL